MDQIEFYGIAPQNGVYLAKGFVPGTLMNQFISYRPRQVGDVEEEVRLRFRAYGVVLHERIAVDVGTIEDPIDAHVGVLHEPVTNHGQEEVDIYTVELGRVWSEGVFEIGVGQVFFGQPLVWLFADQHDVVLFLQRQCFYAFRETVCKAHVGYEVEMGFCHAVEGGCSTGRKMESAALLTANVINLEHANVSFLSVELARLGGHIYRAM